MFFTESYAIVILWQLISIQAEFCNVDYDCLPPKKCCDEQHVCCYVVNIEESNIENNSPKYFGKLNIWNMWYFWFIVLFVIISCCGGCGYWRRRQFLASQHHNLTSHNVRTAQMGLIPETYCAYLRPDPFHTLHVYDSRPITEPPSYSEVVSSNAVKDDLPPYPFDELQYVGHDESAESQYDGRSCESITSQERKNDPSVSKSDNRTIPDDPPPYPGSEDHSDLGVICYQPSQTQDNKL